MILTVDLETYSPQDIGKVGAYRYAQDPDFEILLCSLAVDDGKVRIYDPAYAESWFELKNLQNIFFDPRYTKRAWNAAFEWWCLSEYFHLTQQQREDWLEQWEDSMVHAMYCGLPASLKDAGKALQLPDDKAKMREGKALIRYFCCPCKPTKANGGRIRNLPSYDPAKWQIFRQYNIRDVETERHIDHLLEPFKVPDFIWRQWRDDVRMNSRGIATDRELTSGALWCGAQYSSELYQEAKQITNLGNPKALVFFLALLSSLVPADMSLPGKVACAALLFGLSLFWFSLLGLTLSRPLMRQRLLQVAPIIDFVCGLVFLLVAASIVGRLLL